MNYAASISSAPRCPKPLLKSPRCWFWSSTLAFCARPPSRLARHRRASRRCWLRRGALGRLRAVPRFTPADDLFLPRAAPPEWRSVAILVLTALTLLLFIDSEFTRNPGEYVSVVLMAAAGGLMIAAAQDLLVIFIGLELLWLGL